MIIFVYLLWQVVLSEEGRIYGKRKTKTMRQTCHPQFHQTLFFEACNALGATLVVTLRLKGEARSPIRKASSRAKGAPSQQEQSLGVVHIALDNLSLTTLSMSWYRLIPGHLINLNDEIHSDDSP